MTEPVLSDDETRTLIDYARQWFAEERWPMSPSLRPVREIMEKARPEAGAAAAVGARQARRAELADGKEAAALSAT
jgi:hypothetical protein